MGAGDSNISFSRALEGFKRYRSVSVAANTEDTGVTITGDWGLVKRIWLYIDGADALSSKQAEVAIYRKGEATASTRIPFEDFFGFANSTAGIRTGVWVTTWNQDDTVFLYSADISVLDYFTSSWKIAVKNLSATNTASVRYVIEGTFF